MVVRQYIFEDNTIIDVEQSIQEESFTRARHPVTQQMQDVKRYYAPPSLKFNGSGFYRNDSQK